jgi:PhnB protein
MSKAVLFNFTVDKETNTIKVERSFNGPIDLVWAAWTDSSITDLWWAPKPWRAVTVRQNFTEGGQWFYYMQGPEGERHYCIFNYEQIKPQRFYSGNDAFTDENAVPNANKPIVVWENTFTDNGDATTVNIAMKFKTFEELEQIIKMGFKEGFTMGMQNLDEYIASKQGK